MAKIDELHWDAILDTSDFDKKAKQLRDEAKALNADLSRMLEIYNKFKGKTLITEKGVQNAKEMSEALTEIAKKMSQLPSSVKVYEDATRSANREVGRTAQHYTTQSGLLRQLATLAGTYFSVRGAQKFLSSLIDITGQFEVQKMALTSMLQSSEMADKIFNQYRQLALNSPYTFQDFTKFGKQLTAFNIPAQELVGTTKMLADVAAGLGVDMGRIILAYGQIKSAGVLKGTELRQLTEAGVPILDSLTRQIKEATGQTVQLAEVFDMISKKQIPFEMVEKAFKDMTTEGGKFYNMQEVLVETLQGKIGKLRDVWQQMLYDIGRGETVNGILKGSIDAITRMVSNYETLGRRLVEIVAAYGVYKASLLGISIATGAFELANFKLLKSLNAVYLKIASNPYAVLAAAITGVVYAIYRLSTSMSGAQLIQKRLDDATNEFRRGLVAEESALDALYAKLNLAKQGTEEYDSAKSAIMSKYSDYISQLRDEGVEVNNLADIYENLKNKVESSTRARLLDKARKEIDEEYAAQIGGIYKVAMEGQNSAIGSIERYTNKKMTAQQKEAVWQYISGGLSIDDIKEKAKSEITELNDIIPILTDEENLYHATYSISRLRDEFKEINDVYSDGVNDIEESINAIAKLSSSAAAIDYPQPPLDWQKKVNKALMGVNDQNLRKDLQKEYGFTNSENWETYYRRIGDAYNKATESLGHAYDKTNKKFYQDRVNFIRALDTQFGGSLLSGNKSMRAQTTAGDRETNAEVKRIKAEISNLQKLKTAYDKIAQNPLIGNENAGSLMRYFFGEADFDFKGRIDELTDGLLRLDPQLKEYVDNVKAAFGKDALDDYLKSLSALDKVEKKIDEYLGKDFGSEGEKASFKIRKALDDFANNKFKIELNIEGLMAELEEGKAAVIEKYKMNNSQLLSEVDESYAKELAEAYWKAYRARRIKELTEQAKQEQEYNEKVTEEKIRGLAKALFDEQMEGFDMTNWSDKTLEQIKKIKSALSDVKVSDDIKEMLKDYPELLVALEKALAEISGKTLDNTVKPEEIKKIASNIEKAISLVNTLTNSLNELAEATNDSGLRNLSKDLGDLASIGGSIISGFSQGGWMMAAVNGFMGLINLAIKTETEMQKDVAALRELRMEAAMLKDEAELNRGISTLFGENEVKQLKNAQKAIGEVEDALKKYKKDVENMKFTEWNMSLIEWLFNAPSYTPIEKKSFLEDMAKNLGMSLFEEDGYFNIDVLKEIKKHYTDLTESEIAWIDQAIEDTTKYRNAVKSLDGVMSNLYGQVTSSAADAIIDRWREAGDAAADYTDILDDVATAYARIMLKQALVDSVFTPELQKQITNLTGMGRYEEAMSLLAGGVERMSEIAPQLYEAFESVMPWMKSESAAEGGLAGGIKGITEDTASLLASYINAIRADVSGLRSMASLGWKDVNSILGGVSVLPSLNDYMAQVAATNANIAESNQHILERIDRLTTTASGRAALAVEIQ